MENDKIIADEKLIDEFLNRGTVQVIGKEELKKKMLSGKKLRAYIGYDVTGPNLHLGHASTMLKLRDWQKLGHQVVLLIGDYTARIGDHSDKLEKRKRLTDEEILGNKDRFVEQFGKIIDLSNAELRYNSEWLSKLTFNDVIELTRLFTVQQMIDRENFAIRLKNQSSIGLEELLYPVMQGFDAYTLRVDLQMGGVDQIFNMIAGRKIMENYDVEPQSIITMPLINGTDGRKMSKSWDNYIPMLAEPNDIYGKVMSCTDDIMIEYFTLLTRVSLERIEEIKKDLEHEHKNNPIDIKKELAFEITKVFHNEEQAEAAQKEFERVFQQREIPQNIITIELQKGAVMQDLIKQLVKENLVKSNSEAQRLLRQNAFKLNNKVINNLSEELSEDELILKFGKNNFAKVIVK